MRVGIQTRKIPTKAQQQALLALWLRHKQSSSYIKFRRNAFWAFGECLMAPWAGIIVGIEKDGYTHT